MIQSHSSTKDIPQPLSDYQYQGVTMGSSTSKLKKKLKKGDESSALSLFDTNKDLQRKFDANISYGDRHNHDTPLHLAARHGMKRALR
mgnify:CR=1 FL=1